MITAVDSSVLIDLFHADPSFLAASMRALSHCQSEGKLVVCETVWAEVAASVSDAKAMAVGMSGLGVALIPGDEHSASEAGRMMHLYKRHGGKRERVIPDFLIGAHALVHADRLLTRDDGFFRTYFRDLKVMKPTHA